MSAAEDRERGRLGLPRLHLREVGSTNARLVALAEAGAPHGTLVTTGHQTAGRGRLGRTWVDPPGRALLMSVLVRGLPPVLPLRAAVAVAAAIGPQAQIKWPNDVLVGGRKVSGVLVEGRPQRGFAVVGVGVNVAVREEDLPDAPTPAGTLGGRPEDVEPLLAGVLRALEEQLDAPVGAVLAAWRARDALDGRPVAWTDGAGVARGVDEEGRLRVERADGTEVRLDAGEVRLAAPGAPPA